MRRIEIKNVPNQSFSVNIGGFLWKFQIKETNGVMSVSLQKDDEQILDKSRLVAGEPVIPYEYLEGGNFYLTTLDRNLPDYSKFNISQFLYYATEDEIEEVRENASLFNSIAETPKRFDVSKTQYNYVYLATEDGDILATEDGDLFVLGG